MSSVTGSFVSGTVFSSSVGVNGAFLTNLYLSSAGAPSFFSTNTFTNTAGNGNGNGGGGSTTHSYLMRGYYPSTHQFEFWVTTTPDSAPPTGHALIDITIVQQIT